MGSTSTLTVAGGRLMDPGTLEKPVRGVQGIGGICDGSRLSSEYYGEHQRCSRRRPALPRTMGREEGSLPLSAAVIGGGISGLASAAHVAALGTRVTLFEGEGFLG